MRRLCVDFGRATGRQADRKTDIQTNTVGFFRLLLHAVIFSECLFFVVSGSYWYTLDLAARWLECTCERFAASCLDRRGGVVCSISTSPLFGSSVGASCGVWAIHPCRMHACTTSSEKPATTYLVSFILERLRHHRVYNIDKWFLEQEAVRRLDPTS